MKKQIRSGVFETNSSSVHSLTLTDGDTFSKWESGEYFYDWNNDKIVSKEEAIKRINKLYNCPEGWWNNDDVARNILREKCFLTRDEYDNHVKYYEYFEECYQMPSGEIAIAFGYTGFDG